MVWNWKGLKEGRRSAEGQVRMGGEVEIKDQWSMLILAQFFVIFFGL